MLANLELTREQKIIIVEELGINIDEIILKHVDEDIEVKVSDYNDYVFVVAGKQYKKS